MRTKPESQKLRNLDYALEQARKVMEVHELDTLPGEDKLKELGYGALLNAIIKHHGQFKKFRKKLGEEVINLKDLDCALAKAREVVETHKLDTLPGEDKLNELGYGHLAYAINRYHGRFQLFRERLGEETKNWKSLDYTVRQAKLIMKELGSDILPSKGRLEKSGYGGLTNAIGRYHGNFTSFRKLLGERNLGDLDYALEIARRVMEKHELDTLPSSRILKEMGYGKLEHAISGHPGGFPEFRKKLGEDVIDWEDSGYALKKAGEVMATHGLNTFPSQPKLDALGYSGFSSAIYKYHGGFPAFRERLAAESGVPSKREQLENLFDEYLDDGGAA